MGFAELYAFSTGLVLFFGLSSIAYATYSDSLALRVRFKGTVPRRAVDVLIGANVGWVIVCVGVLMTVSASASSLRPGPRRSGRAVLWLARPR